jgi:nicotinamidase-related amidase
MPSHLVPDETSTPNRKAVIGSPSNFWLHSSKTGFDLTHPPSPSSPQIEKRLTVKTTTSPITIDPAKSALVIIDMQNFFLSPAFGRSRGPGHDALDNLVKYAIPAARKVGMRVVWLNWGLSETDIKEMPPAVKRAFGFEAIVDSDEHIKDEEAFGELGTNGVGVDKHGEVKHQGGHLLLENGKDGVIYRGLGSPCGLVVGADGEKIDAGRLLMKDSWNAALYSPLDTLYEEGRKLPKTPDVLIDKNRMSGLWGGRTACDEFLEKEGVKTLLMTGVNTDQCVGGTFMDAFSKGYDCVLLSDGCGTSSPAFAQQCFEFNAAKTFGFATSCEELAKAVGKIDG